MELISSPEAYLMTSGEWSLRCCRQTGKLTPGGAAALCSVKDPKCVGLFRLVLGVLPPSCTGDTAYLLLVVASDPVCRHPFDGKLINRISRVVAIPLGENDESQAEVPWNEFIPCPKHQAQKKATNVGIAFIQRGQKKLAKGTVDSLRMMSEQVKQLSNKPGGQLSTSNSFNDLAKSGERSNRKMLDEILRLLDEQSFYYTDPGGDLTNSVQRLAKLKEKDLRTRLDLRFFWNRRLLEDLYQPEAKSQDGDFWIRPVIQGFVRNNNVGLDNLDVPEFAELSVSLISRRSIGRAGTRYLKRGIDGDGCCANFVETEQILSVFGHCLSFVQARGSIPLFWTQRGYKYRPAPVISSKKEESLPVVKKHVGEMLETYTSPLIIVNLVDQVGKERALGEAFLDHILDLDDESLIYVAFDFHHHCKGLRFDQIDVLLSTLATHLSDMRFSWADKERNLMCEQIGVFRVNCVDCLDRTNVVETWIARAALVLQLSKMGVMSPEQPPPQTLVTVLNSLWADNGDFISRQYAGTAALKGDFTRSGQRNLAGMMKDGYHSASRYYLNHVRDARRQMAIDLLLGVEEEGIGVGLEDEEDSFHEDLRLLVQESQRFFIPETEVLVGGWALLDSDPGTGSEGEADEMDRVVLLTRTAFYVVHYDEDLDKFTDCVRVPLDAVTKVEVGPIEKPKGLRVRNRNGLGPTVLKIHHTSEEEDGYFHMWRTGSTRLFNNMAIALRTSDEADEYIRAIGEQFIVALQLGGNEELRLESSDKIERKKSKLLNQPSSTKSKSGVPSILSGLPSAASLAVRSKLLQPIASLRKSTPLESDEKEMGTRPADNRSLAESGRKISSSLDGLTSPETKSGMTRDKFSKDDMALLSNDFRPVFCLDPPSIVTSPCDASGSPPEAKALPLSLTSPRRTLQAVSSAASLAMKGAREDEKSGEESASGQMKTSKSEGTLGAGEDGGLTGEGSNNFLQKLSAGSSRFLGITTSSFSKLSSQVQTLGSSAQRTLRHAKMRAEIFEPYKNRIMQSRSKVILL